MAAKLIERLSLQNVNKTTKPGLTHEALKKNFRPFYLTFIIHKNRDQLPRPFPLGIASGRVW
mgnify:CR=1 FL=1